MSALSKKKQTRCQKNQEIRKVLETSERTQMHPNASECVETYPNVFECIRMGANISEHVRKLWKTCENVDKHRENVEKLRENIKFIQAHRIQAHLQCCY